MAKTQAQAAAPAKAPQTEAPGKLVEILARVEATLDDMPRSIGLLGELQDLKAEIRVLTETAETIAKTQETMQAMAADLLARPATDEGARACIDALDIVVSQMGPNIFKSDVAAHRARFHRAVALLDAPAEPAEENSNAA